MAREVTYIALFSEWTLLAADSLPPPRGDQTMHRGASACSHDRVDTLIVSGSMRLVYVQAAAQRSLVSLARKSTPYSSVRAFLHTVRPVFPVAALAERTVLRWSHLLL